MAMKHGQKRMVHAEFFTDLKIGELSDQEKIFIIGLIVNADCEGRILADPAGLKTYIWRFSHITPKKVKKIRDKICRDFNGFQLYKINGIEFIQLMNWDKHQWFQPASFKASQYPPYDSRSNQDENKYNTKNDNKYDKKNDNKYDKKDDSKLSKKKLNNKLINKKKQNFNEKQVNNDLINKVLGPKLKQFFNLFFSKTQLNEKRIPVNVKPELKECLSRAVKVMTEEIYTKRLDVCLRAVGPGQSYEYYIKSINKECREIQDIRLEEKKAPESSGRKNPTDPARSTVQYERPKEVIISLLNKAKVRERSRKLGNKCKEQKA